MGGLARTKLAALRATRLLPCVVTLGLASNIPRRRPLDVVVAWHCVVVVAVVVVVVVAAVVLPPEGSASL